MSENTLATNSRLQSLIDEGDIRDLFVRMGRALDAKDWRGYASTFDDECEFRVLGQLRVGREQIAAGPERDLSRFARTQHLHTNHAISVDGDTATAQVYATAVHVLDDADRTQHYTIGICYDAICRRTAAGWRFARLGFDEVLWISGQEVDLVKPKVEER
jgi:uncharacterized protein (TIGR02246 family)